MPQEAWAHSPAESGGRGHLLREHLQSVGSMAAAFASTFGSEWAELAGRWHDLGKYRPGFQAYIRHDVLAHIEGRMERSPDGRLRTHSAAGALHALNSFGERWGPGARLPARALAYVIAGHHAGLANWHDGLDPRLLGGGSADSSHEHAEALQACRAIAADLCSLPAGFDLREAVAAIPGLMDHGHEPLAVSLWIRMIFSALVDADFLDTEAFYDGARPPQRTGFPTLAHCDELLDEHLAALTSRVAAQGRAKEPVMQARGHVLAACRTKALAPQGVFTLAVPTGGGKTLASLAFALAHAKAHQLHRVVVGIPYTSIVEQTADVMAGIFGRDAVVEHHSQAEAGAHRETARSRLACENWDAPLIVTTNVQLLESLFAARTSRCRKLHNLAGSVIVLDEAQLLPPPFLQPVLDALRVLVRFYRVSLVLCTATQPVLIDRTRFDPRHSLRGLPPPTPIIDDPVPLYAGLERVRLHWPESWDKAIDIPDLARQVTSHDCVLAVVNTRKDAAELVAALDSASPECGRTLHLSAAMCGQHRADVIRDIRQRLAARRQQPADQPPLRVVSTQLVEAGVDIDFPVVYRALAGLDSIAQAAGRCNREGLLGPRGGRVVVFVRPIPATLSALRHGAQATISTLAQRRPETLQPQDFEHYFPLYHAAFNSRDEHGIVEMLSRGTREFAFDFASAAEKFRLVDDADQASVIVCYVPTGLAESPATSLVKSLERGEVDRWRLRALQRFTVSARLREVLAWQARGDVREVQPGLYVLTDELRYEARLGLLSEGAPLAAASLVQ